MKRLAGTGKPPRREPSPEIQRRSGRSDLRGVAGFSVNIPDELLAALDAWMRREPTDVLVTRAEVVRAVLQDWLVREGVLD